MSSSAAPQPALDSQVPPRRQRAHDIVAGTCVLALLYFGRDVLVPITLALILSLLVAPLIRRLRRLGLGQTLSVLAAVALLFMTLATMAAMLGVQLARVASSLPQYEATIKDKLDLLEQLTVERLETLRGEAGRVIDPLDERGPTEALPHLAAPVAAGIAMPVQVRAPPAAGLQALEGLLVSIWEPLARAGIVLVVLVFVLLEHENLRDRFIRIAGSTDLRATTSALDDAGTRLSRYFVSQFAVNFGVGAVLWAGLALIGMPQSMLWACLAAVLRFVPYVGVWIAALFAMVLAAAVDPGWSLVLLTMGLYVAVEAIASQLVEPQLFGHVTGLSPLSVVLAAIFWSWLWGPVGLIVSTPLTLCLAVAGRHVKQLSLLHIALGDAPALTMAQRYYQRALAGDSEEIIAAARTFLKRSSLAAYCDSVMLPALQLARRDFLSGAISQALQLKVRGAIVTVIEALGDTAGQRARRGRRAAVLRGAAVLQGATVSASNRPGDAPNIGRQLRQLREQLSGQWQGPMVVPPRSVVLCVGLGSIGDELVTEIMVRVLRVQGFDARHLSLGEFAAPPPPGATEDSVSMVFIVSADQGPERDRASPVAAEMQRRFAHACIAGVWLPALLPGASSPEPVVGAVDPTAHSIEEATQICVAWHRSHGAT